MRSSLLSQFLRKLLLYPLQCSFVLLDKFHLVLRSLLGSFALLRDTIRMKLVTCTHILVYSEQGMLLLFGFTITGHARV